MKNRNVRLISKIANVSPATVSRYFNGYCYVSGEMKKRIESAIKKINANEYNSDDSHETVGIGYITRRETLNYYSDIMDELLLGLNNEGIRTTIINIRLESPHVKMLIDNYKLKCIILVGSVTPEEIVRELTDMGIHVILVDTDFSGVSSINVNNVQGTFEAFNYLYGLGHRKIAFAGAGRRYSFSERYKGYKKAVSEHNLMEIVEYYDEGDFYKSGEKMARNLVYRNCDFSAVITSGELIAAGLINALRSMKINVPEDVSVVSFGNTNVSRSFFPKITSVSLMPKETAFWAIKLAKEILSGYVPSTRIIIDTKLLIRESCVSYKGKSGSRK